jgi:hypothetical protein
MGIVFSSTKLKDYSSLAKMAVEQKKSKAFFENIMRNLDKHLIALGDDSWTKEYCLPPYMTECRCNNFDRLHSSRRQNEEQNIVHFAQELVAQKHLMTLNYMSIGCGGLLGDFFLMYQMITETKATCFNVVLIEPHCLCSFFFW